MNLSNRFLSLCKHMLRFFIQVGAPNDWMSLNLSELLPKIVSL